MNLGVLFALGALLGWGLGDFSIQRAVRAVGNIRTLFYNTALSMIVFLPFVWKEIGPNFRVLTNWPLLILLCLVLLFTSLFNFEGLKRGKLAVVMPINGLELVIVVLLAVILNQEYYSLTVFVPILLVFIGIILASLSSWHVFKRFRWEQGVIFTLIAAIGLGASTYLHGVASRAWSPLFTVWFVDFSLFFILLVYLIWSGQHCHIRHDIKKHFNIIIAQACLDNLAWLSFCYATIYISIGIASTISEGYLVLATLMGVMVNREKLKLHQKVGIFITIVGVLILSLVSGG